MGVEDQIKAMKSRRSRFSVSMEEEVSHLRNKPARELRRCDRTGCTKLPTYTTLTPRPSIRLETRVCFEYRVADEFPGSYRASLCCAGSAGGSRASDCARRLRRTARP